MEGGLGWAPSNSGHAPFILKYCASSPVKLITYCNYDGKHHVETCNPANLHRVTGVAWRHGRVPFHPTQYLTGNGVFMDYLAGIGKRHDSACMYCSDRDNAGHTVFHCTRWDEYREEKNEENWRN